MQRARGAHLNTDFTLTASIHLPALNPVVLSIRMRIEQSMGLVIAADEFVPHPLQTRGFSIAYG